MRLLRVLVCLLAFLSSVQSGLAQALTEVSWDRNADTDQVSYYEVYVCSIAPSCSPLAGGIRLGPNVAQPPVTIPRVVMPWPINAPLSGRVSAVSVDIVGNKSLESTVVSFRAQPLNAPKGLTVK